MRRFSLILAVTLLLACGSKEILAACPQAARDSIPHGDTAPPGTVETFALSPDAKWAAAAIVDGTVVLWNTGSGEQRTLLDCVPGWVYAIAFSQASDRVAIDDGDGTIHVLDISGRPLHIFKTKLDLVIAVRFSPNGKVLAAAANGSGRVLVERLNGEAGRSMESLACEDAGQIAFDSRGILLAAVCSERTIRVWDVETQVLVQEISLGPTDWVNGVDFSPDERWIIAATGSGSIKVFDVRTRELVRVQEGHTDQAVLARAIPGDRILSESDDGDLRIWDLRSGEPLETRKIPAGDISADGKVVLSRLDLWSVQAGQIIRTLVYKPQ